MKTAFFRYVLIVAACAVLLPVQSAAGASVLDRLIERHPVIGPIKTMFDEARQKKRTESAIRQRANVERQKGDWLSSRLRERAHADFKAGKITNSERMERLERAIRVGQAYESKAAVMDRISRREGRLHLERYVVPAITRKVLNSPRVERVVREVGSFLSGSRKDIASLAARLTAVEKGIDRRVDDLLRDPRKHMEQLRNIADDARALRDLLTENNVRAPGLVNLAERLERSANSGADKISQLADRIEQTGEKVKEEVIQPVKKELEEAHQAVKNIQSTFQDAVDRDRNPEIVPRRVDPVEAVLIRDPDLKDLKDKMKDAWFRDRKRGGEPPPEDEASADSETPAEDGASTDGETGPGRGEDIEGPLPDEYYGGHGGDRPERGLRQPPDKRDQAGKDKKGRQRDHPVKGHTKTRRSFTCNSNSDCWGHFKSGSYFCNRSSHKCIKCPPGTHGYKDGSPGCCRESAAGRQTQTKNKPEKPAKKRQWQPHQR